jgi:LytS/YehU family sensor histidine kinase
MRERFLDGFEVNLSLSKESLSKRIIPCALQVLVENAFKHNAVGPNNPLKIEIYDQDGSVVVCNNINLKNHPSESSGFGLKNLRERYKITARREIEVCDDKKNFTVKLPLL